MAAEPQVAPPIAPLKILYPPSVIFGADPELFLTKDGAIIGAEKVIGAEGLEGSALDVSNGYSAKGQKLVVLDGVQVELNVLPFSCRQSFSNSIQTAMKRLKEHLLTLKDVSASFDAVVDVEQKELDSLSDNAKVLGCAPSNNAYDKGASIGVNAATYTKRSAGGHIHMGLANTPMMAHRERSVPILDILLGNTCVMIDRDPGAAERRKVYGRAGEFRLPKHGLEYRTLSNFWLRSYPLTSLVTALARQALSVIWVTNFGNALQWNAEQELLSRVKMNDIREAINTNNLDLAKKNYYGGVKPFLEEFTKGYHSGLNHLNLDLFDHFLLRIEEQGLKYWFPEEPLTYWTKPGWISSGNGWERFIVGEVAVDRSRALVEKQREEDAIIKTRLASVSAF